MSKEIAIKQEDGATRPAFRLLGPFQVTIGDRREWPGAAQTQRLLVKLLTVNGVPVANGELLRAVWGDAPGSAASNEALHKLALMARRRLEALGLAGVLVNERGKYRLDVPSRLVDVHVFRALTSQARELARDNDPQAVRLLDSALGLRSGEPLAGLSGDWIDRFRQTLAAEIHAAEQALYENAIRHGQAAERLSGLGELYRDHPDDERVTWLYMHALYRTGQQAKALDVKRECDGHLLDEYGMTCGQPLNDLYQRILNTDATLLAPEAVAFPAGETGARVRMLGHSDPRAADQEADQATDRAAGGEEREQRTAAPAPAVSNVFHGRVDARYAVFGQKIINGGPR